MQMPVRKMSAPVSYEKPAVPSGVLAVIMVIIVEAMFFGGLISAFILAKAGRMVWPPADQPRLPFSVTFTNMLVLLASAVLMWLYIKNVHRKSYLIRTMILGGIFFLVQGFEWIRILLFGIQTGEGLFTSFFYTLIGLHGLHVLAGLLGLGYVFKHYSVEAKRKEYALAAGLFWFFVVALWPVLYIMIYSD